MLELRESVPSPTGIRYTDETKEIAYQLWAFGTSRNAAEVSRQLGAEQWGALDVPRETVAYWAREYGWADRATRDVQSIAPDLRHQAFSELLFAGLDGAKYIRQVVSGQVPADKVRTQAAIAAVDRIGFSPVGKGTPHVGVPQSASSDLVSALTDDDLAQRERDLGAGRQR